MPSLENSWKAKGIHSDKDVKLNSEDVKSAKCISQIRAKPTSKSKLFRTCFSSAISLMFGLACISDPAFCKIVFLSQITILAHPSPFHTRARLGLGSEKCEPSPSLVLVRKRPICLLSEFMQITSNLHMLIRGRPIFCTDLQYGHYALIWS